MQASLRASTMRACGPRAALSQRTRSVEVRAFFGSKSGSAATASEFYSFKVQVRAWCGGYAACQVGHVSPALPECDVLGT
jgi:hypothetical protein